MSAFPNYSGGKVFSEINPQWISPIAWIQLNIINIITHKTRKTHTHTYKQKEKKREFVSNTVKNTMLSSSESFMPLSPTKSYKINIFQFPLLGSEVYLQWVTNRFYANKSWSLIKITRVQFVFILDVSLKISIYINI